MSQPPSLPAMRSRGMRDLLPSDMRAFRRVEDAFRAAATRWGYEEIRTPTIETYGLFTSMGALTPQMLSRVYSFLDWDGWSGERVVLRPDSTIPVARAAAEGGLSLPARLFYVQSVFRFSASEVDREEWQLGLEYLGAPDTIGDVEVALVAGEALSALGLEPVVRLSHAGIARALVEAAAGGDHAAAQDLYDRAAGEGLGALRPLLASNPAAQAMLEIALRGPGDSAMVANLKGIASTSLPAATAALEELGRVAEALSHAGASVEIEPAMVRDFEYYTGAIFEFIGGEANWGGGGRYTPAGVTGPASACGLALSVAPLMAAVAPATRPPLVVGVIPSSSGDVARALAVACELHRSGIAASLTTAGHVTNVAVHLNGEQTTVQMDGRESQLGSLDELVALLVRSK